MTYQHVNMRSKILPLAISNIAHLCNHFNHACTANFYATFKSINFYQNIPKIKLFLQKSAKFFVCWGLRLKTPVLSAARSFAPRPQASSGWGLPPPRPPKQPPIANFCQRARCFYCCCVILCKLILSLAGICSFP